jgi:hypothetical protein
LQKFSHGGNGLLPTYARAITRWVRPTNIAAASRLDGDFIRRMPSTCLKDFGAGLSNRARELKVWAE